jgi:hypothetical protein
MPHSGFQSAFLMCRCRAFGNEVLNPISCDSWMSTQMLWQMILHSTSLPVATGVLLRVKRRRRIDKKRRR